MNRSVAVNKTVHITGDPLHPVTVCNDFFTDSVEVFITRHRSGRVCHNDAVLIVSHFNKVSISVLTDDTCLCIRYRSHAHSAFLELGFIAHILEPLKQGVVDAAVFRVTATNADGCPREMDRTGQTDAGTSFVLLHKPVDELLLPGLAGFTHRHRSQQPGQLTVGVFAVNEVLTGCFQPESGRSQNEIRFVQIQKIQKIVPSGKRLHCHRPLSEEGVGDHGNEVRIGIGMNHRHTSQVFDGGVSAKLRIMENAHDDSTAVAMDHPLRETDLGGAAVMRNSVSRPFSSTTSSACGAPNARKSSRSTALSSPATRSLARLSK